MGSGFKDFAAGDILTAADVDGYLMRQTVMTFADASARDSALSGVLDEGMVAYLEDTNRTTYYDGSAWQDIAKSSSIGTWTTFTPSLNVWTLGNGTLTGAYCRINDVVGVYLDLTLGSTSTVTGSTPTIDLPFTASTQNSVFSAFMGQAGVDAYMGLFNINTAAAGGGVVILSYPLFSSIGEVRGITSTAPFNWGDGDQFRGTFFYRSA